MDKMKTTSAIVCQAIGSHQRAYDARLICAKLTILPPMIVLIALGITEDDLALA